MKFIYRIFLKIKIVDFVVILFSPIVIPITKLMVISGIGTNVCLKFGFLPVPVHFYHPIPDIKDLKHRKIWSKTSKMGGIKIDKEECLKFIKHLGDKYENECEWPNDPSADSMQFHLNNGNFSYGCAAPLHCIIREYKPGRIVEIGSGNSSKIIAAAIRLNEKDGYETQYTIIDPYLRIVEENFTKNTQIIRQRVELLDNKIFESLKENDILFIDSSHVCKIGSDVNFLILDILPLLKKNVFIHFHDIPLPFEYPEVYSTNSTFRAFWTESYLLQAFLTCNTDFQVLLPMVYLQHHYLEQLKKYFPKSNNTNWGWVSGSFWIKRVNETI